MTVTLYDHTEAEPLPWARYEQSLEALTTDTTLDITEEDYSDADLDADHDGQSNLSELHEGSDPYDVNSPAGGTLVHIVHLGDRQPPVIDRNYDDIWNEATFDNAASGTSLLIDNLLVDNVPPGRVDEGSVAGEYQWATMHDDTHFYLMVFGEQVGAELGLTSK